MADRWFYTHDGQKNGPCSGQQLKEFAACGGILPTDTVWKDGIAKGSLARKVRYLFPPGQVDASRASTGNLLAKPALLQSSTLTPSEERTPAVQSESLKSKAPATEAETVESIMVPAVLAEDAEIPPQNKAPATLNQRNRRAVAVKGVMIVGQDGTTVKYRKKCTVCGYEDSCWNTMAIPTGSTRVSFFCPKCRKGRDGEIHGTN
jgi:hypothetical protein